MGRGSRVDGGIPVDEREESEVDERAETLIARGGGKSRDDERERVDERAEQMRERGRGESRADEREGG